MGEVEKKPEETKAEEKAPEEAQKNHEEETKPAEKPAEEIKAEESKPEEVAPPPPPPTEIVLKVFMHCEGCARKVRRCLKGFPGVEKVVTDCKSHMVVVKGEKADPLKVLERIQKKSHRKVELLSPIPKPEEENKVQEEEKPKPEPKPEVKEESPIVTVLKVHMHCEACAQEIKRRIQRMKGVESAETDLKNSQVSVKGVYDPAKLVEYVYKRSGKHAVIMKQEEGEKKEKVEEEKGEEKKEEEKKSDESKEKKEKKEEGEGEETKGEGEGEGKAEEVVAAATLSSETATPEENNNVVAEVKINEYFYNPQRYGMEVYAPPPAAQYPAYYHAYPPQIFSDENPNACTVM